jgi:hypothetical protein
MEYKISPKAQKLLKEPMFKIFKHDGLYCCIQRVSHFGNLNGYVAIGESHPFFGKDYSDKVVVGDKENIAFNGNYIGLLIAAGSPETQAGIISIDLALDVHGGITYSDDHLYGIENGILGKLWWFGFDTLHSGDLKVFEDDIDRRFPHDDDEYRDFDFVEAQTRKLAEQLAQYGTGSSEAGTERSNDVK